MIFYSTYFPAIQKAIFYKKSRSKMFKCKYFLFLELQGSCDQNKNESKEKLPVEKWPHIFDRINRLGLETRQRMRTISYSGNFSIFL